MVRLQKLYSKFKAIESGRAVTEVTKGSCCGRRDRWRPAIGHKGHRKLQDIGGFVFSQQIGISPHCAVASNLVVLYPLSSGNQSGVFYFSVDIIFFFKDLTALLYQTFHAFAFLRFGFLAHPLEDLFNPLSMLLGLVQMLLECVAQLV